jgi:hypothetical protein
MFHILRLRDDSQVSISMALANALAVIASLARMEAVVAGLVCLAAAEVTVLVGFIGLLKIDSMRLCYSTIFTKSISILFIISTIIE